MQHWHGFVGYTEKIPVQVRSGGEIQGLSGESYGEITAKGKAEVGTPALDVKKLLSIYRLVLLPGLAGSCILLYPAGISKRLSGWAPILMFLNS